MMTNESLRERLGIAEANYPTASIIIKNTIEVGLIKPANPSNKSRRQAKYLPYLGVILSTPKPAGPTEWLLKK